MLFHFPNIGNVNTFLTSSVCVVCVGAYMKAKSICMKYMLSQGKQG